MRSRRNFKGERTGPPFGAQSKGLVSVVEPKTHDYPNLRDIAQDKAFLIIINNEKLHYQDHHGHHHHDQHHGDHNDYDGFAGSS